MTFYLGIDPGLQGAVALLDGDRAICERAPILQGGLHFNDATIILQNFRGIYDPNDEEHFLAYIEMPPLAFGKATSIKAITSLHRSHEAWRCALDACVIEHVNATPMQWKKHFKLDGQDKGAACDLAQKLFGLKLARRNKADQGVADAVLLALFGRQKMTGEKHHG